MTDIAPLFQCNGYDDHMSVGHPVSTHQDEQSRWKVPAVLGAATVGATALIAAWGPGDHGTPMCASQLLFGVDCPLCGGTRSVYELTQGNLIAAADQNLIATIVLPILAVLWGIWLFNTLSEKPIRLPSVPKPVWIALGIVFIGFGLVRNLDTPSWAAWLSSGLHVT